MFYRLVFRALCVSIFSSVAAQAAIVQTGSFSLSPDSVDGYPRIRIKDDTLTSSNRASRQYVIGRAMPVGSQCTANGEITTYRGAIPVCRRVIKIDEISTLYSLQPLIGGAATDLVYTDKSVRLDDADPSEYQYTVNTLGAADLVSVPAAACNIDEALNNDPLERWVSSFKLRTGLSLSSKDIPYVAIGAPPQTKTLPNQIILFVSDVYVAVFTDRGNLIGMTNRALGEEFITYKDSSLTTQRDVFNPWPKPLNWLLAFGTPTNSEDSLECSSQSSSKIESSTASGQSTVVAALVNNQLVFTWSFKPGQDFTGTVETKWSFGAGGNTKGLMGRLLVNGTSSKGPLLCASFPNLAGLGIPTAEDHGRVDFITGSSLSNDVNNSGSLQTLQAPSGNKQLDHHVFSGDTKSLQFFGFVKNGKGLYLATNDLLQRPMGAHFINVFGNFSSAGNSFFDHFPTNVTATSTDKLNADYDVIIKPMCGGWNKFAKEYRNWALPKPWLEGKNTRARQDIDPKIKKGLFWWLAFGGDNAGGANSLFNSFTGGPIINGLASFENSLNSQIGPSQPKVGSSVDVDTGVQLYEWYGRLDKNAPMFTANNTKGDWKTTIAALQGLGLTVIPYTQVNHVDISDRPMAGIQHPSITLE